VAMHLLAILEGVDLSQIDFTGLAAYIFVSLLLLIFFFAVGRMIGSFRSKLFEGLAMLLVIWFSFIYFIPGILDTYIEDKADKISSFHKLYEEKMKIVDEFEKRSLEELGKFTEEKRAVAGEYAESYIVNEYKQIEALEEQFKNEIADVAESCNNLRILFPTTFYNLVSSEVSGRSNQNLLDFYSYLQKLRRQFLRHWKDRVFKHDVKVLVKFVKKDENLFKAQSRLPKNFWIGVISNSVWIILALLLGNFLFKRKMFPLLKNPEETDEFKLQLLKGDKVTFDTYAPEMIDQFNNVLSGHVKSFKGEILIDDIDITTKEKENFLSLCTPDQLPDDLKPLPLLKFFKRTLKLTDEEFNELKQSAGPDLLKKPFAELDTKQKINILLAIIKLDKWPIIVLHDLTFGLKVKEATKISEKIMAMELDNTLIIDIVTKGDTWFTPKITYRIKKKDGKYRAI
jgi:ABC-type transport system involved in multi-copper enzyme maturation permease subunit